MLGSEFLIHHDIELFSISEGIQFMWATCWYTLHSGASSRDFNLTTPCTSWTLEYQKTLLKLVEKLTRASYLYNGSFLIYLYMLTGQMWPCQYSGEVNVRSCDQWHCVYLNSSELVFGCCPCFCLRTLTLSQCVFISLNLSLTFWLPILLFRGQH